MQHTFSFACSALDNVVFIGFRGAEHVSQPYEFEVFFSLPADANARRAVGERATVRASRGSGADPLVIHGMIANVRLLHQTAERAVYQALLVPKLWMLRHFWRSHVFTNCKIKDFLTETLQNGGIEGGEMRFAIHEGSYPTEEFVVQYRETHLSFFHRWLEREGLYYYFEHPEDGANEVLVIADDRGVHEDFPAGGRVRYFPIFGDDASAPVGFHQLQQDVQWLPKSVTIADYNYANPSASVLGQSDVTANGLGTIRDYGARVFVQSDAQRLALVRAQSIGCREVVLRASGTAMGPRSGYTLSLDEQPDDVGEKWLAIEVQHTGSAAGITAEMARMTGLTTRETYRGAVVAIPASTQFRAAQSTPWPRIYGFENGLVCGPADSQYAQIDSDGRYTVRFEFDTSGLPDSEVSTRLRMMQPHGGTTEGFHFPLRKGTEVMIGFLGGDPDRPFITGVVPNAHRPSVVGERNHTQNILRTGSGNQLVLEDEKGREFIYLSTPKHRTGIYMGQPTGNHSSVYTGDGDTQTGTFMPPINADPGVGGAVTTNVEFSYLETTEASGGSWVGGDSWENVVGSKFSFVKTDFSSGVLGEYTFRVGGNATETYHQKRTTTIKHGREDTVEADGMTQTITGGLTQTVNNSMALTVNDGMTHVVNGMLSQTVQPGGGGAPPAGTPPAPATNHQRVIGDWTHQVTALEHDDYGNWQTDVAGTWNGEFGGDVHLNSATNFKITAPMAKVSATDLKWEIAGFTFDRSPNKHELYFYKGASGVIKTDHAAVYQSAYGLKLDFALIKFENAGAKKYTYGAVMKQTGAYIRMKTISTVVAAMLAYNVAFTKL
ncbi:MAG: type VI secretion system tip protein TssI/VgrG [Polyangiaceae bacterium]